MHSSLWDGMGFVMVGRCGGRGILYIVICTCYIRTSSVSSAQT